MRSSSVSEYFGWLAVGSKGRVHHFKEVDSYNPMKRIAVCGRKLHVFNLIEPTEQMRCNLCEKFLYGKGEPSFPA